MSDIVQYEEDHKNSKFRPEMCDELIAWMSKGYSYTTWGIKEDMTRTVAASTMYLWEKKYPEWKHAKEIGYHAGLRFFETLMINCSMGIVPESLKDLKSRGINLSAVIFTLKTRFHREYGEKSVVDHISSDQSMKISFVEPPLEIEATKIND